MPKTKLFPIYSNEFDNCFIHHELKEARKALPKIIIKLNLVLEQECLFFHWI